MKIRYDCSKCPGYCCSYPNIEVKGSDLERLAAHFGITKEKARKRFTEKGVANGKDEKRPRVLLHQDDEVYGTVCWFFDLEKRRCSIYEARPDICRDYPGQKRCGYYEFLRFERKAQDDPDYIAVTGN